MEYENIEQVNQIAEQIKWLQNNLNSLNDNPDVVIRFIHGGIIYTIGTDSNCEHEYSENAIKLISDIKTDLQNRINNLKSMLNINRYDDNSNSKVTTKILNNSLIRSNVKIIKPGIYIILYFLILTFILNFFIYYF